MSRPAGRGGGGARGGDDDSDLLDADLLEDAEDEGLPERDARLLELKEVVKSFFEVTGVGKRGWEAAFQSVRQNDHLAASFLGELRQLLFYIELEYSPRENWPPPQQAEVKPPVKIAPAPAPRPAPEPRPAPRSDHRSEPLGSRSHPVEHPKAAAAPAKRPLPTATVATPVASAKPDLLKARSELLKARSDTLKGVTAVRDKTDPVGVKSRDKTDPVGVKARGEGRKDPSGIHRKEHSGLHRKEPARDRTQERLPATLRKLQDEGKTQITRIPPRFKDED